MNTPMEMMHEYNEQLLAMLNGIKHNYEELNKADPHEEHENTIEMLEGAIFYQEELKENAAG